MAVEDLLNP